MSSKQTSPEWREAAGHMIDACDAAERLAVVVNYLQDISKKGLAVNLVTDEMADLVRDLSDEMVNALRNAVAAKRSK
jgi:hypothetical protein